MKKLCIIFILLQMISFNEIQAQQNDSLFQKIDEYLLSANKVYKFNGSALVAINGKIILNKAYGKKSFAKNCLNDTNTIFQIGSITKQFTAAVILKLQEEGKLSVNDKLSKYFPEFKYADEITLDNLLTHTSGIYDYASDIDDEDSALACNPVDKQIILNLIFKHAPDFKPGTKFRYCNSGYYLLGLISEKITGKLYEQNVRDIIFAPLQMAHSLFDFKHSTDTNIATGYQTINDTNQTEAKAWRWDSTVSYAAGGIYSTTGDLYKWSKAIADEKILSSDSWKAALTLHLQHYGYGFYIDSLYNKKAITHGGGIPGFISYLCYYPDDDVTIILLNNRGWFGDELTGINADISAIIFHKHYELMKNHEDIKLPFDSLKKFVGTYEFDKKHYAYITLENGSLQMEAPEGGLPKSPLFAENENNFYLKVINAGIEFVKDAAGNVVQLIARYNGKTEICKKIK